MSKARDDIAPEYVRSALDYDPETGVLRWKMRADMSPQWNGKFAGQIAGTINDSGYVIVSIYNRDFRAHRLAWVIMTGNWPDGEVDHKDLVKSHNHWDNLRPSTHSQNNQNKRAQRNNTSGCKGVSFCKLTKTWVARMKIGNKYVILGRAQCPEDAHVFYREAAKFHRGQFANTEARI